MGKLRFREGDIPPEPHSRGIIWEFALAEHEWAGDEGILATHGLLLGDGDVLFKTLRVERRIVAMIPQRVRNNIWP
eukprot:287781-Pleurochrysis_carterae.AAC.1